MVVQNPDGTRVITEDPSSSIGTVNGTLEVSEAFLIDGAPGGIFKGRITFGGQDLIVSSYDDAGTTYFTIYVPSGTTAEDLGIPSSLPASAHRVATLDLPEVNDYQVEVQASDGMRTSTQTITISVLDVDEGAALLSGNSLSTVKLSVDSFDHVEGEIVSSPSDPEDQLEPISTTPLREPLPDYEWADDGFTATQMQLDLSDALDGL